MGSVCVGHLFLEDERDRSVVLARLNPFRIPVAMPVPPFAIDERA